MKTQKTRNWENLGEGEECWLLSRRLIEDRGASKNNRFCGWSKKTVTSREALIPRVVSGGSVAEIVLWKLVLLLEFGLTLGRNLRDGDVLLPMMRPIELSLKYTTTIFSLRLTPLLPFLFGLKGQLL